MSSDSEEDFQSADEGADSDLELKEEKESTSEVQILDAPAGDKHAMQTAKDSPNLSRSESPKLSPIKDTKSTENVPEKTVPNLKDVKVPNENSKISDQAVDALAASLDNVKTTANNDTSVSKGESLEKNLEESLLPERKVEVSTSSSENKKEYSTTEKLKIETPSDSKCEAVDDSIPQPISKSYDSEEKLISSQASSACSPIGAPTVSSVAKNESEASKDALLDSAVLESSEALSADDNLINSSSGFEASQPKKTSKIGLKKPREKLGERLGTKRLGQKISKPLESISCDSLSQELKSEEKAEAPAAQQNSGLPGPDGQSASEDVDTGWGGAWGGWGSTLINAASTLTQEVGRGVGSVVELVEEGIGVPSPEELAKEQLERERMLKLWDDWGDKPPQEELPGVVPPAASAPSTDAVAPKEDSNSKSSFGSLGFGGLTSLVSGVSGALESAGSKVVYGGLDTLELIGRRTMDVLHDSDPGLRAKKDRFLERVNKPNLSAVLREAREQAVANPPPDPDSPSYSSGASSSRVSFSCLWTNSTGPAHLEALALIARQCTANTRDVVAGLPSDARDQVDSTNSKIMALSEIEEENLTESSIFAERVSTTIRDLHLPLNADNIAQCWSDLTTISKQYSEGSVSLLEAVASVEAGGSTVETNLIGGCVALVERLVAVAHKAAELSLISGEDQDPVALATNFRELVVLGGSQLESCADAVCAGLSSTPQQEQLTPVITNIYMQVCEGSSCLQQSLVHLCTTLQLVVAQRAAAALL